MDDNKRKVCTFVMHVRERVAVRAYKAIRE